MTCDAARGSLLDLLRGDVPPDVARELELHLASCAACARVRAEEQALTDALEGRLPTYRAPRALKRRLAELAPSSRPVPLAPAGRLRRSTPALAAAVAVLLVTSAALVLMPRDRHDAGGLAALTTEALNDHLRVLQRDAPAAIESSATHQVKPWFEGKLDFAPSVPSPSTPELRLEGGSVGYLIDRPAAVVLYRLRQHRLTLLAFRAEGLPWPESADLGRGHVPARASSREYHVFVWRSGGIGYALVGDVEPTELSRVAGDLASQT